MKIINVDGVASHFVREELRYPFGFKGGYLTELWQTVSLLRSSTGIEKVGLATQSVLYGDADLFASHGEAEGNALMYGLMNTALALVQQTPYRDPIELFDNLSPS